MKKIVSWVILAFSFFIITYLIMGAMKKGTDEVYLLPNHFEGCVVILYNIPDAPPLEIIDNEIIYEVPENGIIETSSPMEFGWVNQKHSGPFRSKAFYVDEDGKIIEELPQEAFYFGANGSFQFNDEGEQDYFYTIISMNPDEESECLTADFLQDRGFE